jgi:hypothetical protein
MQQSQVLYSTQTEEFAQKSQFLSSLWRSPDRTHFIGTLDKVTRKFQNIPVKSIEEAISFALAYSAKKVDVYFACAGYKTSDSRKAENAEGAWALYADIDVGPEKAAAGKGYASLEEAKAALEGFCKHAGIPEPTHLVESGSGIHVYWVLTSFLSRQEWQELARKLKGLTQALGLRSDPSRTADIASVLRIPGTLNHKYDPPRPVLLLHASPRLIEKKEMLNAIDRAHEQHCIPPATTSHASPQSDSSHGAATPNYGPPNIPKLLLALTALDPDCDDETWKLRRLAPLAGAAREYPDFHDELRELARLWSCGDLVGIPSKAWVTPGGNGKTGAEVFDVEWKRFLTADYAGRRITIATIYYDAKAAGWDARMAGEDEFQRVETETVGVSS